MSNRENLVLNKFEDHVEPRLHRYSGKFALMLGFQYWGVFATEDAADTVGRKRSPNDYYVFLIA